jgi:hypothetical protein
VRREAAAEDSFAAIFDRRKLGIAMAAMIRIMATTMSNSINENPFGGFCLMGFIVPPQVLGLHITSEHPKGQSALS